MLRVNNVQLLLVFIIQAKLWNFCETFNLDISTAEKYRGPKGSMFGFSVAQHQSSSSLSWLLIGAPNAESGQPGVHNGGAVFRCRVGNRTQTNHNCEILHFDITGNSRLGDKVVSFKSGQLFGATVKSSLDNTAILACAPRYTWRTTNKFYLVPDTNGQYKIDQPVGTCFVGSGSFDQIQEYSPCRTDKNHGHPDLGFCQVGFGADLAKDGGRTFLGAVGSKYFEGQISVLVKNQSYQSNQLEETGYYQFVAPPKTIQGFTGQTWPKIHWTNASSEYEESDAHYLGYSVASGEFNGDSIPDAAGGMPRGNNLTGLVIIFNSDLGEITRLPGEQIGSYFGHSLCVLDANGDGLDDIVIAAPLFSDYKSEPERNEVGRVYVHYQRGRGRFDSIQILSGHSRLSRFGFSLSSLGDLNADGFDDLAIGAPYGGPNGQGAVYIYNGRKGGIQREYSQVIYGSNPHINLRTFGFSLSGGKDLDGNGYSDLVIGAYESDAAVYIRSFPVINCTATITFSNSQPINLDQKTCTLKSRGRITCFSIELCMIYEGGPKIRSPLDFNAIAILDSKKSLDPRMFLLDDERNHIWNTTIRLKIGQTHCYEKMVYMQENIRDKKTTLDVDLKYELADDSTYLIDREASEVRTSSAIIMRNCGPDNVCIPDLELTILKSSSDSFVLGSVSRIWIDIEVTNHGNDSHSSRVYIKPPNGTSYQSLYLLDNYPVLCSNPQAAAELIECDIGDPLPSLATIAFRLYFQIGKIETQEKISMSLDFTLRTTTSDPEINLDNNDHHFSIPIKIDTELQVFGYAKPSAVILYNVLQHDKLLHVEPAYANYLSSEITHTFEIRTRGPSDISKAHIEVFWPVTTADGQHLLHLLRQPIVEGDGSCDFVPVANNSNIPNAGPSNISTTTKHWEISQNIHDECEKTKCIKIRCEIGPLAKNSTYIHLRGLIQAETLRSHSLRGQRSLTIVSNLIGQITELPFNTTPALNQVEAEITSRIDISQPATSPWWVYALISLSGIVILLLLIWFLSKCGFFKRQRPTQVKDELTDTGGADDKLLSHKKEMESSHD